MHAATSCKIVVGGAVLTEAYAKELGADAYAPNAVNAVRCINEIFAQEKEDGR